MTTRAVYVISVAAELTGTHPQTLRIYERKGLVVPARTAGGARRYSDEDLAAVARIQELTAQGVNLAGVRLVLELLAERDALTAAITALTGTDPTSAGPPATGTPPPAARRPPEPGHT